MTKNLIKLAMVSYLEKQKTVISKVWSIYTNTIHSKIVPGNEIPGDGLANAAHVFTNRGIQDLRTRHLLFGPQMRNIPITHVRIFAHRNKLRCLVSRQTRANLGENYV